MRVLGGSLCIPLAVVALGAQPTQHCALICAPALTLMPGMIRTHALHAPRVRELSTNRVVTLAGKSSFELIGAFVAPTAISRVSSRACSGCLTRRNQRI